MNYRVKFETKIDNLGIVEGALSESREVMEGGVRRARVRGLVREVWLEAPNIAEAVLAAKRRYPILGRAMFGGNAATPARPPASPRILSIEPIDVNALLAGWRRVVGREGKKPEVGGLRA